MSNVMSLLPLPSVKTILFPVLFICVLVTSLSFPAQANNPAPLRELKSGWYSRVPYQMEIKIGSRTEVAGLEIQAARELFAQAGYSVSFDAMPWSAMMDGLRNGTVDFVMGAYFEEYRTQFAHYSIPYRKERNTVYYHENLQGAGQVGSMEELIEFLSGNPLRMAIIGTPDEYAYGSEIFTSFLKDPPEEFSMVSSQGYNDSMNLVMQGRADFFVASQVIGDRMLAETGYSSHINKMPWAFPEIPVHVMFSRKSISAEQVETFNSIIESMLRQNRIRSLHTEFLLPVYLSIATQQFWFDLLTLLGIVAFCFSGVLLARKEHYNLFGALVLAILPAIGGGVLRDLFLGVDQVFVLKTPAFMIVAISVVIMAFAGFKSYDYLHARSREHTGKIDRLMEKGVGLMFGRLFKFFDAWAVAIFTVVGVNVALESQAGPLWLWGPAMAVLTASGGVVLRDIVRADFNIEMLKQDSYAEISILGGILYTGGLMLLPSEMNVDHIFYLTMTMITLLFALRSFILWKGYANPLQFGAQYRRPATRLEQFVRHEPELWNILSDYYREDSRGRAIPAAGDELEGLHNRFIYAGDRLRGFLDQVAGEPLDPLSVSKYRQCSFSLEVVSSVEENLYAYLEGLERLSRDKSAQAMELQQHIHESLKTLLETTAGAVESNDPEDFSMLEGLTSGYQERFNRLRVRYGAQHEKEHEPGLEALLQATHRVERIIYLLSDYVLLRLNRKKTDLGGAFSRKAQQVHLLR